MLDNLLGFLLPNLSTPKRKAIGILYLYNIIVILVFTFSLFFIWFNARDAVLLPAFFLVIFYFSLYSIYKKNYTTAKYILSVVPVYAVVITSVVAKVNGFGNNVIMYLTPRILSMALLLTPIILFSVKHKKEMFFSFLWSLIPIIFFDYIHHLWGVDLENLPVGVSYYPLLLFFLSCFFITIYVSILLLQVVNLDTIAERENAEFTLVQKSLALSKKNTQLEFHAHLFKILQITSRYDLPLKEVFKEVLTELLKVQKLGLDKKGVIFIKKENGELELVTQIGAKILEKSCAIVKEGECLCGKVLVSKENMFCNKVGHQHDIVPEGMKPHGHYVIPIKNRNEVLGIINVYIKVNEPFNNVVEQYLHATADILARRIQADRNVKQIEEQKGIISSTLKDVTDSLNYAMLLQSSLLPSQITLNKLFNKSYFMYLPKDVVSGDFYFAHKTGREGVEYKYFGIGDCTGHGIPGAFLSVMSIETVTQVIFDMPGSTPEKLLEAMRLKSKMRFATNVETARNDMLDMALCRYQEEEKELMYAGANLDLYIVRKGELLKYRGTRNPIGHYPEEVPYELYTIKVEEDDNIYLFSDGLNDQFGYSEEKKRYVKLKRKGVEHLLLSLQNEPFEKHKTLLYSYILNWKKDILATDDITLLCVQV